MTEIAQTERDEILFMVRWKDTGERVSTNGDWDCEVFFDRESPKQTTDAEAGND